jgi:hypothetical protein
MDVSFGRVEPALRDDGVDFAPNRPNATLQAGAIPLLRERLRAISRHCLG